MQSTPSGVWPVMLTPFAADGQPDLAVLDRYTDWLIDRGATGLFPVALSGEMYELDEAERLAVASRVVARASGRVPVAAAIADPGTPAETAAAVARMSATGVDIVVLVASVMLAEDDPERRLRDVVTAVIEADSSTVLGIYECPLPYHRVLSDDAVAWLAATGRFAFFKETSHDLDRMRRRVELAEGSGMQIFNAGIENLAESLTVGIAGLSGWVANVFPDGVARVHGLADGTVEPTAEALELQAALVEVEHRMGASYPNSAKALVELRAGIGFAPRSRWRPAHVNDAEVAAILADASAVLGVPAR